MTGNDNSKTQKALEQLVRLDYDAIEAYEAAIDRIEDDECKSRLSEFCGDHRRHTENLSSLLKNMGAEAPQGPDTMQLLTKGKVVLGSLIGDKAILMAMRVNEDVTNKSYEEAVKHLGEDPAIRTTVASNLQDERRHREWITTKLEQM